MRTHRIIVECVNEDSANKVQEFLEDYFVDFTHWFCGLDGAGEDTPQHCIMYRGYIHPENITVEFDMKAIFQGNSLPLKHMLDSYMQRVPERIRTYKVELNNYI